MTASSSKPPPQPPPLEIERVFLLDRLPELPAGTKALRIEQGYLRVDPETLESVRSSPRGEHEPVQEGRVRRIAHPDGRVECVHTVKRGVGRVRTEIERPITPAQFEEAWPQTEGRRIRKTRHVVREGPLTWEIDAFDDLDLVLAEVELPQPDTPVTIPPWLAPRIVREVTDEPEYRNYSLAVKVGLQQRHQG